MEYLVLDSHKLDDCSGDTEFVIYYLILILENENLNTLYEYTIKLDVANFTMD